MPTPFYSLIVMVISAITSLILFLRIQRNQFLVTKPFFWHYAFAFAILSAVNLPVFFINLAGPMEFQISYNFLMTLYGISFLAVLFSYVLFLRGTVLLFTKDKFLTTIFPLFFFPLFAILVLISFSIFGIKTNLIYTAVAWGFLLPLSGFLGSLFLYSFFKGAPFDTLKRQFSALLLSAGWFLLLMADIWLWWMTATFPDPEFWILRIAGVRGWFLLRAATYLIILIGSLLHGRRLERPKKISEGPQ